MKRTDSTARLGGAAVLVICLLAGGARGAALPEVAQYLGSEGCAACHPERFQGWRESYHFAVVQDPRENPAALLGDFSQGKVDWHPEDVEFTIGGHWYQRYAVELDGETYVLPDTWSVASHRWEIQDGWSWRKKPYRTFCIGCHAVRYDPASGTLAEHTVGCEACHGPGRRHGETGHAGDIQNPGRWSTDEQDLLCASCHVRGMDPSGTYHFAVGYVPGRDLTRHYRPHRVADGETVRAALLRLVRQWQGRLGQGAPPTCAVCGMERQGRQPKDETVTDQCLKCHEYGDSLTAHTRHPGGLQLECLDCHRERGASNPTDHSDVHSPDYFRVHRERRFDFDLANACQGCHAQVPLEEVNRQLDRWDHSDHDRVD